MNQEIAIATFLRLEGMGFYQRGVKREGILNYQIYNALPFEREKEIIRALEKDTQRLEKYLTFTEPHITARIADHMSLLSPYFFC